MSLARTKLTSRRAVAERWLSWDSSREQRDESKSVSAAVSTVAISASKSAVGNSPFTVLCTCCNNRASCLCPTNAIVVVATLTG